MSRPPGIPLDAIPTPALLADRRRLLSNIARMSARAHELGVRLRPHVKTHKCVEIARLQVQHGAAGLTVSTLAEAAAMAAAGFEDLTWALPLAPVRIPAALELARRVRLRLLLDDPDTLDRLEAAAPAAGVRPHVWLKIDCGYGRAGVDPESEAAADLARRLAASTAVRFDGLLTHAGHSYHAFGAAARLAVARQERDTVVDLAQRLRREGIAVPEVSLGSTPTLTAVDHLRGVDEARPGNYVFFDLTQVALGSCRLQDVAVSVLTSVISHPRGARRAVVDAGALALSRDAGPGAASPAPGLGAVLSPDGSLDPDLTVSALSQEHGVVKRRDGAVMGDALPVGAQVRLLPNHSCLAAACFDRLHVVEEDRVVEIWRLHRQREPEHAA